jgi:hypothetical protein
MIRTALLALALGFAATTITAHPALARAHNHHAAKVKHVKHTRHHRLHRRAR